jgi:hypothetical protein
VRFPVQISDAAETDEKITHALLMSSNPAIKEAVTATPSIQPSVPWMKAPSDFAPIP